MINEFKEVYIKYISKLDSYLIIKTIDGSEIIIDTHQYVFPHLVGKNHIPEYKNVPAKKFISDIVAGKLNKDIFKKLKKEEARFIKNKLKAIDKIKTIINGTLVHNSNPKNKIGKHIIWDAIIHITHSTSNDIAIVLKKLSNNIFTPCSMLWLGKDQEKNKIIKSKNGEKIVSSITKIKI